MITKVYDSITKASTREMEEEIRQQKLKEYNQSKLFIKFQDNYILDLIQTMYFKKKNFFNFWEFNDKFGDISSFDKIYIHNSKALIPNLAVIESRIINNATIFVVSYNFEGLI